MARYLDEFAFRSNHLQMKNAMFDLLIAALGDQRRHTCIKCSAVNRPDTARLFLGDEILPSALSAMAVANDDQRQNLVMAHPAMLTEQSRGGHPPRRLRL